MSRLNFLHLSDLHYDSENIQDSKIILENLWSDIDLMKKEKGPIDFIIFSGDLVKKGGNKEEFSNANEYFIKPLLERTNLTYNEFFLVPGNHDIEKDKVNDIFEKGDVFALNNRDILNLFIDDMDKPSNYIKFERLSNFYYFYQSINSKYKVEFNILYATYNFEKNGIKIGIACLNSSWRATGKSDNFDHGKLLLGERQIDKALKDIKDCDIKIAVFHHPLSWLSPFDSKDINRRLIHDYNILCIGHSHDPEIELVDIISDRLIISQAGALYQDRKLYNGYSYFSYDVGDNNTLTVFLRSYFDSRRTFDRGIDRIKDGEKVFNVDLIFKKSPQNIVKFSDLNRITSKIVQYTNQHLLSASGDSFAPKELTKIFVPPYLIKRGVNKDEYKKEIIDLKPIEDKKEVLISSILDGEENFIIFGKKESGKTTLLNYLCYSMLEKEDLSKIKLPIYVEYSSTKSTKSSLIRCIKNFLGLIDYDLKKGEIEKNLEDGKFLILIDDMIFERTNDLNNINEFLKKYPKNKYIFTSTENIDSKLDIEHFGDDSDMKVNLEIKFDRLFIDSFDRKKTRQLVTNWFQNEQVDIEIILNNILNHIAKTNIPRSPTVISILLWVYEKQANFVPINKASLIEKFVEVLLEKLNLYESSYKDFDYRDKEHYLSYIAKRMVEENRYAYERIKLEEETIKFLTQKRGLRVKAVSDFVNYFIYKGIFVEFGNIIAFKYKCFCEYFIAKRMMYENDFYLNIISEKNYLAFKNEIDYLTGLQRNNKELLKIIFRRLDKAFEALSFDVPLKLFNNVKINFSAINGKSGQKTKDELRNNLRKSKLDDNTRDSLLNYVYPENVKNGKQIERYYYREKEKGMSFIEALEIFSKITRNSDQIEDLELWKECLKKAIHYWAKIVLYLLGFFELLIKNAKIISNMPLKEKDEEEIRAMIDYFFKTFPLRTISELINEYLGTKKFELIIEDILDNEDLETIEELLSVFLYSDLELNEYISRIEKLVDRVQENEYILELIYRQLQYYYFLRKLKNIDNINIENLISEIYINLSNNKLKGSKRKKIKKNIGKKFRELKKKVKTDL